MSEARADELKGVPFTSEEIALFVEGYKRLGRKWTRIANEFVTTRTATQVCTFARWYAKKIEADEASESAAPEGRGAIEAPDNTIKASAQVAPAVPMPQEEGAPAPSDPAVPDHGRRQEEGQSLLLSQIEEAHLAVLCAREEAQERGWLTLAL